MPFRISQDLLDETLAPLQEAGREGFECFVVWLGTFSALAVTVERVVFPSQQSLHVSAGCHVRVNGDELFRISRLAHESHLVVCGQVHSHPFAAYHSEADNDSPLVSLPGALSAVVPTFALGSLALENWALFRLLKVRAWEELNPEDWLEVF